jgi:predicted nucleotidyltransferase
MADIRTHSSAAEVVERAVTVAGDAVVGVVVYGSWARGSAGPGSDVDVLIVLDAARPLTRGLYREWDARPIAWEDFTPSAFYKREDGEGARDAARMVVRAVRPHIA